MVFLFCSRPTIVLKQNKSRGLPLFPQQSPTIVRALLRMISLTLSAFLLFPATVLGFVPGSLPPNEGKYSSQYQIYSPYNISNFFICIKFLLHV